MVRVQEQQERVAGDAVAALIHLVNGVARQLHGERARLLVAPVVVGHLVPVGAEPGDVLDLRAANLSALKKFATAQNRVCVEDLYEVARELQKVAPLLVQVPVEPRNLVVLTPGVVVAALRSRRLVPGDEHRDALRQQERREEVSHLPPADGVNRRVFGRAFDAVVETEVVVVPVAVAFAVRLVVLLVVADEVSKGEAVVRGDEVDAGVRASASALVEVAAARQTKGEVVQLPSVAAPE